jgi:predicted NUDIX family NTP pyrophosphohydrolase
MSDGDTVKIKAVLVKETAQAGLYETDDGELWVPKSQIVDGDDEEIEITRWFAEEHGLVDEDDEQ